MTETQWLASTDPQEMLRFLEGKVSERKLRLFACAWWRSIEPHGERNEVIASTVEEAGTYAYADPEIGVTPVSLLRYCMSNPRNGVRGANLLRDIVGNPFRPLPDVRAFGGLMRTGWLTNDVLGIAEAIYEERAWDRMPILADALQEAGCDNEDILRHCRGIVFEYKDGARWYWYTDISGPQLTPDYARAAHVHSRGCWIIDLLLGKS